MRIRTFLNALLIAQITSITAAIAATDLINIDFGNASVQGPPVGPAAVGHGSNDVWNLSSNPFIPTGGISNLAFSDGTLSGASMLVENDPGAWVTPVPDQMFNIYAYSYGGPIKVTITNLPSGTWDIYGYGHGEQDSFTTRFEADSAGVHYGPLETAATAAWRTLPWVEGAQYVVLRDVGTIQNGNLVITASGVTSATPYLNGLQLIRSQPLPVTIEPDGALFTNQVSITLSTVVAGRDIRYTLDGSDPTPSSQLYQSPIILHEAATLKAQAFRGTQPDSDVAVAEYLRVYAIDDGIPADWRRRNFGAGYLTDPRVGADADPDNDGATNLQEYIAGTDPLDPLSGFAVSIKRVPSIVWTSIPGKSYNILRKTQLAEATWETYKVITATATTTQFTDEAVADSNYFYAIEPVR